MSDSSRMQAYYRKQPRTVYDPEAVRERIDRDRMAYREFHQSCPHGRVRRVGSNEEGMWAALECRAGSCAPTFLSAQAVFAQWRDAQPDLSPAGP